MAVLYLLGIVLLAKIVLDSPVGRAMGDALRGFTTPSAPRGAASQAELEQVRRDVEELRDQIERVVEEQAFITRLLSEPRPRSLGSGHSGGEENRD